MGSAPEAKVRHRGGWPFWVAVGVAVVGIAVTGALTWVSARNYSHSEKRLLGLRARDLGTALTSALPSIQTALGSAAALADATSGNVSKFKTFTAPYVGTGRSFESVSLWLVKDPARGPVAVAGRPPALPSSTIDTAKLFARAATSSRLTVVGLLHGPNPSLGYALTGMTNGPFAAYGDSALPSNRYAPAQKGSAFNDLSYALYLGGSVKPANLLVASVRHTPLSGTPATVKVPFGDTSLLLAITSQQPLTGSLPQRLPWIIAVVGALLTLGATALTVRLIERRRATERLADELEQTAEENRRLFAEQRGIAQTLQRALLPDTLPELPGLQVSARYESGIEGVDVGGDWYDLIRLDERRLLLVVGDVSGRGLSAATAMASLRFAIHAYAAQGDDPVTFLPKLSRLVSVQEDRHLATILCAVVDAQAHEVIVTSAGHLPPLIIGDGHSEFVATAVGLPVGVDRQSTYASATVTAPPGATFLAFTDGLVERRGESIEVGLERLRSQVSSNHGSLDQLLVRILDDLRHDASDDTAVAGIRWVN